MAPGPADLAGHPVCIRPDARSRWPVAAVAACPASAGPGCTSVVGVDEAARVDAVVHAPAAFRRRGVYVAAQELEVA